MIEKCADGIVSNFIANNIIEKDDAELYVFGIMQGLRTLLGLVSALLLSILFHQFLYGVVVLTVFMPIRIFSGGYHAQTPTQCFFESMSLQLIALIWIKFVPESLIMQIAIFIVTAFLLWKCCPVPDEHKPLLDYEIGKYRRIAFLIFGIEICCFKIGRILGWSILCRGIAAGQGILLIVLILGIIKNVRLNKLNK